MDRSLKSQDFRRDPARHGDAPADRVYAHISDAILEQRLRPGTKLGEQALSEIFDVNRPVIRRALMRLSYERLVDIRPHRGASVASPTPDEARQIFEARQVIERWTVAGCISRADKATISDLRRLAREEADATAARDRARWVRLSGDFHLALARAAGNMRLYGFLEDLVAQTSLIISLYGSAAEPACADEAHVDIVDAIAAGDAARATGLMDAHLKACESGLVFDADPETQDLRAIFSMDGGARRTA